MLENEDKPRDKGIGKEAWAKLAHLMDSDTQICELARVMST